MVKWVVMGVGWSGDKSNHHVTALYSQNGSDIRARHNTFSCIIEVNISEMDKHNITWFKHHGVHDVFPTRATYWLRCFPVHSVYSQFKLKKFHFPK